MEDLSKIPWYCKAELGRFTYRVLFFYLYFKSYFSIRRSSTLILSSAYYKVGLNLRGGEVSPTKMKVSRNIEEIGKLLSRYQEVYMILFDISALVQFMRPMETHKWTWLALNHIPFGLNFPLFWRLYTPQAWHK